MILLRVASPSFFAEVMCGGGKGSEQICSGLRLVPSGSVCGAVINRFFRYRDASNQRGEANISGPSFICLF